MPTLRFAIAVVFLFTNLIRANAQDAYAGWRHNGSIFILTTPEGANLPASCMEKNFPLLVHLHKDFFDFRQANARGDDLRFSTSADAPLAYEIEEWDAAQGVASIWVRIPEIKGDSRQEIRLHWGKPDAVSESNGKAVFNESNGYLSVWHMADPAKDEVGTLEAVDTGTLPAKGVVGAARRFPGNKGIFCGDKIAGYPTGSGSHSSEAWFRAEKPNARILAWGNEKPQGKVVMEISSPPHIRMECYFSDANVAGKSAVAASEWTHVVHTYQKGESKVYVNGRLDGVSKSPGAPLKIPSPAKMWIGGWFHNYNFVGEIDEVRISKVVRSADWVKLQYENQRPQQNLVGLVVRPGKEFSVSPTAIAVQEGKKATVRAEAGGAQKLYWILKRDGRESVVAVDRLTFEFDAGRVVGDSSATLQLKAIYPSEVKLKTIPIAIEERIPEPAFALAGPAQWNGRDAIEVIPRVGNLAEMRTAGASTLNYAWTVSGLATVKEIAPGKLILKRAQNSGKLIVTTAIDNGGRATVQSMTIDVKEPGRDAWVERIPADDERPADDQFYARDDRNEGTLFYKGTLKDNADSVFVRVTADDRPFKAETQKLNGDRSYAFAIKLKPGLVKYKVEFGSKIGDREIVLHAAANLVCGDAYLIQGQSNAEATDVGKDDPPFTSEWIRSFGSTSGDPKGSQLNFWGDAVCRDRKGGKAQIGYWGLELAKQLVENQKMPICIINGAVGGTRIDQHQRDPKNPLDATTIYGRLLGRVQRARLTHGIRGVLWHQGENDQGADGPTGGYGWETYEQYFIDLAAGWKQDFPNIQRYYVFQIWPQACAMGVNGSDNRLREVQRRLPAQFSNMGIMSTLGIKPPGGCHFPPAGYAEFARLIGPLVERDNYSKAFAAAITPPDLKTATFADEKNEEIVLTFDQPVVWKDAVAGHFYLDGAKANVDSVRATGNRIALRLKSATAATKITYLDSRSWNQGSLLLGENGIAALTFCEVAILPHRPAP